MTLLPELKQIVKRHVISLANLVNNCKRVRFLEFEHNKSKKFVLPFPISLAEKKGICVILGDIKGNDSFSFLEFQRIADLKDYYSLIHGRIYGIEMETVKSGSQWTMQGEALYQVYHTDNGYNKNASKEFEKRMMGQGPNRLRNITAAIHNIHHCA